MDKLYPVIKYAKTSMGLPLTNTDFRAKQAYCPVCGRRLWMKKVHPKYGDPFKWEHEIKAGKTIVGKPVYCESCGALIHPLS